MLAEEKDGDSGEPSSVLASAAGPVGSWGIGASSSVAAEPQRASLTSVRYCSGSPTGWKNSALGRGLLIVSSAPSECDSLRASTRTYPLLI